MHLDRALHLLGDWGRYETLFFIFLSIAGCWFPAFHIYGLVFVGDAYIKQECNLPPNATSGDYQPDPKEPGCNLLYQNETLFENCPYGVNYNTSYPEESSAFTEYGLVCERKNLAEISQSIFFAGVLVGAYVSGQLSDIIGRRPVFLGSLVGECIFGILLGLSWDYVSFIIFWFFVGMFENGINITMYVLLLEMFAPNKRGLAGALNNVSWGIGVTILAPIAYFFKAWRTFTIVVSLPCLLAIPLWFFLVESPRWLLSRDRKDDAIKVLKRIEKFNNVHLPEGALDNLTVYDEAQTNDGDVMIVREGKRVNFLHVFRKPRLLMNAFIMYYAWLVNSMVYYGLLLSSSFLVGDKYLNFFLLALVEVPAYITITFTMVYWGRRPTMVIFLVVAGIFCIITAVLQQVAEDSDHEFNQAIIVCAMIGKLGITASYGAAFLYGTEIFPTSIRNVGFGLASLSARIGGIIAPLLFILADVYIAAPLLIFGVSSLVASVLCIFLPETLNRPLPETLDEANNLHRTPPIDRGSGDVNENNKNNTVFMTSKEI